MHRNLWDGESVFFWRPLVWLGHLWQFLRVFIYIYIYIYCVFGSLISDVTCNYVSADLLMGEGMACGGLPFLGTGCPILDVDNLCLLCIHFYVWDAVSIFNHIPRMFLSIDFAFRITDWTSCHGPHLDAILRIISRGVSGLATDSPCGVWGRGWITCLLHDSPLFGSYFKMRVGM